MKGSRQIVCLIMLLAISSSIIGCTESNHEVSKEFIGKVKSVEFHPRESIQVVRLEDGKVKGFLMSTHIIQEGRVNLIRFHEELIVKNGFRMTLSIIDSVAVVDNL